jgi:hypothetical protein
MKTFRITGSRNVKAIDKKGRFSREKNATKVFLEAFCIAKNLPRPKVR